MRSSLFTLTLLAQSISAMTQFNVAVYLYPNADILDFSGPAEIYSYGPLDDSPRPFKITTFAHQNPVPTQNGAITYIPGATFQQVEQNLADYDVLVIPGANFDTIATYVTTDEGKDAAALIKKFVDLKPRQETGKRVLQSVCTGAILLASSGVLAGRNATTHHLAMDMLKKVADQAANGDSKINIQKTRWVDAGFTQAGVRIINAGGVSSGIDTSMFVVEELAGKAAADLAVEISEFERRTTGFTQ